MTNTINPTKDENKQSLIPDIWKQTLKDIVLLFKDGDYLNKKGVSQVTPISKENALIIANNIKSYGCKLTELPEDTWQTSACQWMRSYWEVLVDLYTVEEGASDLALSVRVYEQNSSYIFEIQSVYVP